MTDAAKPEAIPPAGTDAAAFDALMHVLYKHGGFSETIYRMRLLVPDLFDPAKARANAHAIATALRKAANELCDATRPEGQPRVRELYSVHGEAAGLWFCGDCQVVHRSEHEALVCCGARHCEDCGTLYAPRSYTCEVCWTERRIKEAAETWEKATPVETANYGEEMIYVEQIDGSPYGSRDGYFHSPQDLAEHVWDDCDSPGAVPTLYVYACYPERFSFDASDLLDSALEEMHDGARDEIDDGEVAALDSYLKTWAKENSPTSYYQDSKKKIIGWEALIPPWPPQESENDEEANA